MSQTLAWTRWMRDEEATEHRFVRAIKVLRGEDMIDPGGAT
jgi:hypothetical protein